MMLIFIGWILYFADVGVCVGERLVLREINVKLVMLIFDILCSMHLMWNVVHMHLYYIGSLQAFYLSKDKVCAKILLFIWKEWN